jgi:outer membrane protein TolC
MVRGKRSPCLWAGLVFINLVGPRLACGQAQLPSAVPPTPSPAPPPAAPIRLTLEEARQRALANNKLLALAAGNIEPKEWATRAVRADYFPKIIGNATYFHFDNPLGCVPTTPGRAARRFPELQTPGATACSTNLADSCNWWG